ncbi:type II secretory pathway, component ExeA (predicted ATPase) [Sphaerochaeta pleomorpha str. Grapes]|uniref:Type II secretory pathway, component ExeA (Predicted ATPase) n=1 Tax=Sphaerochaeta pleomorpha (strain ATCC BAA-1885 / DSM 22778 / Grapes) TaxID=158190 RepID=G8QS69_SPHPG|nr:AAA family ATPase [Sphaerochaeta pleomorpha]AEV28930.1 type II secretory pathway, component ExeA (predicted ATPase) [Sphaerochaeta pleomorpha str. Grapes]
MNTDIRTFYGFRQTPFSPDIRPDQMYLLSGMVEISKRIQFAVQNNMYFTVIGDVGAGKSTSLRYALHQLPQKSYQVIDLVGGQWGFVEVLRQCMASLGIHTRTNQPSSMLRQIHEVFDLIRNDGKRPVLFVDEAHLFQTDVFAQLHLISQQNLAKAIVMCGQDGLFEKLRNPQARPLMNRVIDGYNLRNLTQDECFGYIDHHLKVIGGCNSDIFEKPALIAIGQVSAGIPRNINSVCLLALGYGMDHGTTSISAETIRNVSRNWWE